MFQVIRFFNYKILFSPPFFNVKIKCFISKKFSSVPISRDRHPLTQGGARNYPEKQLSAFRCSMRDRRVLVHMHGGGVSEESEDWETFTGGERWIKMMVEAGIEADDQRGIGGQSRVKTLYATDLTPPSSSSSSSSHRKKSIDRHASSYNSMAPFFPLRREVA